MGNHFSIKDLYINHFSCSIVLSEKIIVKKFIKNDK